jgi:2,4-dienoyl-CoA reductase (NADPH2)
MLPLRNQFIMAPVKLGYGDGTGVVTQRHMDFYSKRSKHLGAVTIEPFYLRTGLRELPTQLGIDDDNKLAGLQKLTNGIHAAGAKVIAHLNHPGRMANPKLPGNYFWSSTDQACENGGAIPERMDLEMMEKVIRLFVESAQRAVAAGFDIIEVQSGHGYLLAQFMSPAVNNRKDEYGGSFENRIKFPVKVVEAVKNSVDVPVIARISGDEMIPEGFHIDEMINFARVLEKNGIDALHVTAGTVCSTPPWFFQHMFIPKGRTWELADAIREATDVPVIYVGRINTMEDIEKLLNTNKAAYLAMGRSLVADPDFVGKYFGKEAGQIIPCLACAAGCLGGVKSGKGLQCLVNPEVGRESASLKAAAQSRKFAVVGGGLAGMEAAITLRKRGHTVDLYEKHKLGGQFNYAPLTPNKKSMESLVPYFVNELKNRDVKVFHKEVTRSDSMAAYDGVLLATGSRPSSPDIPGLKKYHWAEVLLEENLPENKKVLIIGGGLIGVDIATALIPLNNQILIVKRTTDFGEDMEMIAKNLSLEMMKEKKTIFSDHTFIKKVEGSTVYADKNNKDIQFDNVDVIVVSTGMKPYNPLEKILHKQLPVYVIGDARKIGNAQDAIRDGYETAKTL